MNKAEKRAANIELIPASPALKPVLSNLLELYTHDFCDFLDLELRPDGRFGYKDLDLYWTDPVRHPLLLYVDGKLAGFVLIKRSESRIAGRTVWDMVEFFILRSYRRHGIGTRVAHQAFSRFPGHWEVRVMESNRAAYSFWGHATRLFAGESVQTSRVRRDDRMWYVFSFESGES
jgi:predicted acetyltransferase